MASNVFYPAERTMLNIAQTGTHVAKAGILPLARPSLVPVVLTNHLPSDPSVA